MELGSDLLAPREDELEPDEFARVGNQLVGFRLRLVLVLVNRDRQGSSSTATSYRGSGIRWLSELAQECWVPGQASSSPRVSEGREAAVSG